MSTIQRNPGGVSSVRQIAPTQPPLPTTPDQTANISSPNPAAFGNSSTITATQRATENNATINGNSPINAEGLNGQFPTLNQVADGNITPEDVQAFSQLMGSLDGMPSEQRNAVINELGSRLGQILSSGGNSGAIMDQIRDIPQLQSILQTDAGVSLSSNGEGVPIAADHIATQSPKQHAQENLGNRPVASVSQQNGRLGTDISNDLKTDSGRRRILDNLNQHNATSCGTTCLVAGAVAAGGGPNGRQGLIKLAEAAKKFAQDNHIPVDPKLNALIDKLKSNQPVSMQDLKNLELILFNTLNQVEENNQSAGKGTGNISAFTIGDFLNSNPDLSEAFTAAGIQFRIIEPGAGSLHFTMSSPDIQRFDPWPLQEGQLRTNGSELQDYHKVENGITLMPTGNGRYGVYNDGRLIE